MAAPKPESKLPPGQRDRTLAPRGESARGVFFAALLHASGLGAEAVASVAAPLASEEERVGEALDALLAAGVWTPPGSTRPLRIEDLSALPRCGEWLSALDQRALRAGLSALERYRLGHLYELVGEVERAAGCFRQLMSRAEPLPYALAAELGVALATTRPALALAAIDRLASATLNAPSAPGVPRPDALSLAQLLDRARGAALAAGAAPRAAALGRAAVSILERANLRHEARRCQVGTIEALCAADQADVGMGHAKRMRESAQEDHDPEDEARAILVAADQLEREGEPDKTLALRRRAAALLEDAGELLLAAEPRLQAAALLARRGQLEQARQEVAAAAERLESGPEASDPARRRRALELRGEEVDYALRLGRPELVLTRADQLRRAWEELGDPRRAAGAMVVLAQALLLAGDLERSWKALERSAAHLESPFARASSLRVRAELRYLGGDPRAARLLLYDAERLFREAAASEWEIECLLRRGELHLSQGEPAAAREVLTEVQARAPGLSAGRFELRRELLAACLSEDEDEVDLLLEDLEVQAEGEGQLADRVLVGVAKARRHLGQGDFEQAEASLQPLLGALVEFRQSLPTPFQKGIRDSPLGRPVLELADELKAAQED